MTTEAQTIDLQARKVKHTIEMTIAEMERRVLDLEEQHIEACDLAQRAANLRDQAYQSKETVANALLKLRHLVEGELPVPGLGFRD